MHEVMAWRIVDTEVSASWDAGLRDDGIRIVMRAAALLHRQSQGVVNCGIRSTVMLGTILVTEELKNYGMWKGTMQSGIRTVWGSS